MHAILKRFAAAAADPHGTARAWKAATGGKVVGTFPMHFPAEVIHAAGALPVILQEADEPITVGHGAMYPFFCGYTRSVVDQAAKGDFSHLDAIMFGDHCVQLLSAADVIRMRLPELRVGFYQFIPALKDNWSFENAERSLRRLIEGSRRNSKSASTRTRCARACACSTRTVASSASSTICAARARST